MASRDPNSGKIVSDQAFCAQILPYFIPSRPISALLRHISASIRACNFWGSRGILRFKSRESRETHRRIER
jgi:hypothetical protein